MAFSLRPGVNPATPFSAKPDSAKPALDADVDHEMQVRRFVIEQEVFVRQREADAARLETEIRQQYGRNRVAEAEALLAQRESALAAATAARVEISRAQRSVDQVRLAQMRSAALGVRESAATAMRAALGDIGEQRIEALIDAEVDLNVQQQVAQQTLAQLDLQSTASTPASTAAPAEASQKLKEFMRGAQSAATLDRMEKPPEDWVLLLQEREAEEKAQRKAERRRATRQKDTAPS